MTAGAGSTDTDGNTQAPANLPADEQVLSGGGEMGRLMRSIAWSETAIGPVSGWSQALRTTVGLVIKNRFPILVWWGPRYIQIYNSAFQPILGDKHPRAMGQSGPECWAEIWDVVGPLAEQPLMGGEATWNDDLMVLMNRKGFAEETHFNLAYSPIPDESVAVTGIGGVIATVAETTEQIYGARQMRMLRELGARLIDAKTPELVCTEVARTLQENPADVPFTLLFLVSGDGTTVSLASHGGFQDSNDTRLQGMCEQNPTSGTGWPFQEVMGTRRPLVVSDLHRRFPVMPAGPWATPPNTAMVLPLGSPDRPWLYGMLVLGLNPHRALDDGYQSFCDLTAAHVVTALRNVYAAQEDLRRAEALVLLDRAKTAFFSNVSHEFRTPLTLMLGPLEELIAKQDMTDEERDTALDLTYRNALRLLKLVNTLLDFARVEAKRVTKFFRPTDLGDRVRTLTGSFRFAIEKAGLRLLVHCEESPEPVYVDADLFEKIVLNLLSNALKFTFTGEIEVSLRYVDRQARLVLRDTGIGIPELELPKIFERFHRVEGSRGRSIEGSGIGLALVKELVQLHGGTIAVDSRLGVGSTFTICLPLGSTHLPREDVAESETQAGYSAQANAHVKEALHWLPEVSSSAGVSTERSEPPVAVLASPTTVPGTPAKVQPRIMVVDDNSDMRRYLRQMLMSQYHIDLFEDGQLALVAAQLQPPDLILTDVMMPVMDGFALLAALRSDDRTRAVPIIMLSARAGEEAGAEGLRSGADDYIVKPFTSRELFARIESTLRLTRMRRDLAFSEAHARAAIAYAGVLALRNEELARLNAELDQFAYVSSHDLREPLRMVTQYMGILGRDLGNELSEKHRQYLGFAVDGATRMQALITDLLVYSQTRRTTQPVETVDLNAVMADILELLKAIIVSSGAVVDVHHLPTVPGIRAHLLQLFQCVLDNAIKFRSKDPPRISIWSDSVDNGYMIHVKDNGIGIDPAYHASIFKIFQRLHTAKDYQGTGMGLSLCAMVAKQHGGRIEVTSTLHHGATFHIFIPAVSCVVADP